MKNPRLEKKSSTWVTLAGRERERESERERGMTPITLTEIDTVFQRISIISDTVHHPVGKEGSSKRDQRDILKMDHA